MKKTGLGRGMGALMGEDFSIETLDTEIDREYIHELPINSIDVNKSQPRKTFDSESIEALAESIRANGLLQPITVQKKGDRYEIVAGERRYRACRLLALTTVPAIIKELSPRQVCELALVENLQREDLNPIETAVAIDALMNDYSLTQQEVAERIGSSRSAVANALRLLKLPEEIKQAVISSALSAGHARAFLALEDSALAVKLASRAVSEGWSVRQTEQAVKNAQNQKPPKKKKTVPEFERIEENIRLHLGTKVKINGSEKKGKIEIDYFSRDDLERLISLLSPDGEL